MKHQTLSVGGFDAYRKTTRKAEFLSRMDLLVPWAEFYSVIEPFYPKAGDVTLHDSRGDSASTSICAWRLRN